MVKQLILGEIS